VRESDDDAVHVRGSARLTRPRELRHQANGARRCGGRSPTSARVTFHTESSRGRVRRAEPRTCTASSSDSRTPASALVPSALRVSGHHGSSRKRQSARSTATRAGAFDDRRTAKCAFRFELADRFIRSMPNDDGGLIVSRKRPRSYSPATRRVALPTRLIGARDLLNGGERWCLWLKDARPGDITSSPFLRERVRRFVSTDCEALAPNQIAC